MLLAKLFANIEIAANTYSDLHRLRLNLLSSSLLFFFSLFLVPLYRSGGSATAQNTFNCVDFLELSLIFPQPCFPYTMDVPPQNVSYRDVPFQKRWDILKPVIIGHYIDEDKKVAEVAATMKAVHGFDAVYATLYPPL
jgi:Clr5 domain